MLWIFYRRESFAPEWYTNQFKAACAGAGYRVCELYSEAFKSWPIVRAVDHESELAQLVVLLIEDALVSGHHGIEAALLTCFQQVALFKMIPSHLAAVLIRSRTGEGRAVQGCCTLKGWLSSV